MSLLKIQNNYSPHFRLVFNNYFSIVFTMKTKLLNTNLNINLFYIINNHLLFN